MKALYLCASVVMLAACAGKPKPNDNAPAATTVLVEAALIEADKALLDAEDAASKTGTNLQQAKVLAKEIEARSARLMR